MGSVCFGTNLRSSSSLDYSCCSRRRRAFSWARTFGYKLDEDSACVGATPQLLMEGAVAGSPLWRATCYAKRPQATCA